MTDVINNKKVVFSKIPEGLPEPDVHLKVVPAQLDIGDYQIPENGLVVKNLFISLDPYLRGRMRAPEIESYIEAFPLGSTMTNIGVAEVLKSKNSNFTVGDIVIGMMPMEEYSIIDSRGSRELKVNKMAGKNNIPLSYYLGILGMPGMTAYGSLSKYGKLKSGETLFVSAANGAVGQVVGQIAKIFGLKVVGSAGSDQKVEFIKNELGFDDAFNYRTCDNLQKKLQEICPNGIDVYFDNVGGPLLDAVLSVMNKNGRILLCGYITEYNHSPEQRYGVKNFIEILLKQLTVTGFLVFDFQDEYAEKFEKDIPTWIKEGKLKYLEDIQWELI